MPTPVIDFRVRLPEELRPPRDKPKELTAQYDAVLDISTASKRSRNGSCLCSRSMPLAVSRKVCSPIHVTAMSALFWAGDSRHIPVGPCRTSILSGSENLSRSVTG